MKPGFELTVDAFGRLVLTQPDGERFEGVVPVRAFPIQAPLEGISLLHSDGHEVGWIEHLDQLDPAMREQVQQALQGREFMPVIRAIRSVSSFATPSTWQVQTDRGEATLVLRGEEDIRRVDAALLIITDTHGVQFLVRDRQALDTHSRRLLDRFL